MALVIFVFIFGVWGLGTYGKPWVFIRIEKREKNVHMYSALHLRSVGVGRGVS